MSSFLVDGDVSTDLRTLVELLAEGELTVDIGWRGSWEQIDEAVRALRERRVNGKAVLDVSPSQTAR